MFSFFPHSLRQLYNTFVYLLTWSRLLARRSRFPRDEKGHPYLPGDYLMESLKDAVVFYLVKRDKALEGKIKRYLSVGRLNPEDVAEDVWRMVSERYPFLKGVKFPEVVPLDPGGVQTVTVGVFDLKAGYEVDTFKSEAFSGFLSVGDGIPKEALERIRYAGRSFTEALVKMEMAMLGDHPLTERFHIPLLNDMRRWEIPLRLGRWTTSPYGGRLMFFWRIKEVRERILRDYGTDIRPRKVLLLPRDMATAGWSEIKTRKPF